VPRPMSARHPSVQQSTQARSCRQSSPTSTCLAPSPSKHHHQLRMSSGGCINITTDDARPQAATVGLLGGDGASRAAEAERDPRSQSRSTPPHDTRSNAKSARCSPISTACWSSGRLTSPGCPTATVGWTTSVVTTATAALMSRGPLLACAGEPGGFDGGIRAVSDGAARWDSGWRWCVTRNRPYCSVIARPYPLLSRLPRQHSRRKSSIPPGNRGSSLRSGG